jgi:NADH:ubiquinone oxidoreductase subunit F (NADH-binding)/NAD-dependent dihydropyrimidine dehydrogenase PreA subunit/(2Fe-2S) ferredoxin
MTGAGSMTTQNRVRTAADLEGLKRVGASSLNPNVPKISVGTATCGLATGAADVFESFRSEAASRGLDLVVARTGCIGFCQMEPIVLLNLPDKPGVLLKKMTPKLVPKVLEIVRGGELPRQSVLCTLPGDGATDGYPTYQELGFYRKQVKVALRNCGFIDPGSLPEYVATDGYYALFRALTSMKPAEVISQIKRSGLRGRGGAGFPTGRKWEATASQPAEEKFIVCNADEGDPGAYMDRSILEGDPHAVLEGMIIGAYAVGASQGFIYIRDEYPEAIRKFQKAIHDATAAGFLGRDVLGTGFNFIVRIVRGGGAFVCGEETALIASLEGLAGEPRQRPPFPAQDGLWHRPTNINNVETWANVPRIILEGPEKFASLGTPSSKGTKVFSLVGKVANTGLIEVPMGLSLREVVFDIGGGVPGGKRFKAIQTGGPSGGCLPESLIDLPVDYEQLPSAGTIMGSGGMIVMDENTCMVDVARYFLDFLREESCGKCTPCREGIGRMLSILNAICEGRGREEDLQTLEHLAQAVQDFSLCGLGQTAPNPVLTTLRYFRDEYLSHVRDRRCPAGVCKALVTFTIDPDTCTGCTTCVQVCPSGAISGEKKQPHVIDQSKCIKCSACYEVCRVEAVRRE